MRLSCSVCLSAWDLSLLVFNFLLQLIAVSTTRWAHFSARIDLGKPKEEGHFGLWKLCSTKAPLWIEDCDSLDTFFEAPPYIRDAGYLAIFHLLLLVTLMPLSTIRALQLLRKKQNIAIKTKVVCIAKVALTFFSVIISILVAILASLGENKPSEYVVTKDWSFWTQITVIVFNVVITMLCATENFRFWQQHIRENADPYGQRSETYGNPAFYSGSPDLGRREAPVETHQSENGTIAFTMTSGEPYSYEINPRPALTNFGKIKSKFSGKPTRPETDSTIGTLTYENMTFVENSPTSRRSRH